MNEASKILLVDDDPAIRRLLKRMLSVFPVSWIEAETSADGLTNFLEHSRDIRAVWIDVRLPDGSGYLLAESIRATAPEMPVVILSGAKIDFSSHGLQQSESTYSLQKPFSKPAVMALAEKVFKSPATA